MCKPFPYTTTLRTRGRVAKVVAHRPPIENAARTAIPPTIPCVPVIRHLPSMLFDAAETAIAGSIPPAAVGVQRPETHIPERPFSLPLAPSAPTPEIGRASCRERVCQYV